MHPLRLKAFRGFASAAVVLMAAVGCETDGETVPTRTAGPLPPAVVEPSPVLFAAADTATPVKVDKPAAAADISTNTPTALTTEEATAKAIAEVGATVPASVTSTNEPVITEEIPPARPANLKISEATEKILKLVESNLDQTVILTFVQQTPTKFELDADEIVYLSDVGVPSTVIAAMLKHDGEDPSKAENLTDVASTEHIQPALPAGTNLPPSIAQLPGVPPQEQPVEVTTNYIPNQVVQQQPQTVVEQQPTVVYAQPETVTYFYDSLAPYGSWCYVNDYGWCWQPTVAVVDRGWRPYGPRGHWMWTDAGWYWQSDYTWGWAPFHYGRWHLAGGRGWLWVPDHTWGPAWVTWRSYGDYCGWAPLPPHAVFSPGFGFTYYGRGVDISFGFGLGYDAFCFAPVGHFHSRHVYDYCLPRHETHNVYAHSRVANNWQYGRGERTFVNRSTARVENGARPASIRTMSETDRSRWGNRERVERGSRDTVIYRPPPPTSAGSANVVAGNRRSVTGAPGTTPNWTPRTRAEVANRPSTTASGIAANAGQPNVVDPSRRGSPDRFEGQTVSPGARRVTGLPAPSTTTPSPVANMPSPTRGAPGPVISTPSPTTGAPAPSTTTPAPVTGASRATAGLPSPSISTPSPTTGAPRPSITTPAPTTGAPRPIASTPSPITSTPAPSTSTPGIGSTADTASRIRTPQNAAPPARPIAPTGRPIADSAPITGRSAGSPNFSVAPRSTPEAITPGRGFSREVTTPSSPAPAPTTVAPTTISPRTVSPPPTTVTPSPRIISPPPTTVAPAPRIISPPPASAAPARINPNPSAPTYSAPAYTPPVRGNAGSSPIPAPATRTPGVSSPTTSPRANVSQAPVSRAEGRQAGAPNTVSRGRGRSVD